MMGNYVYVIRYEDRVHKIGMSGDPRMRLASSQTKDARSLSLVDTWYRPKGDAAEIEARVHELLRDRQSSELRQRERFMVCGSVACAAVSYIEALVDEYTIGDGIDLSRQVKAEMAKLQHLDSKSDFIGYIPQRTVRAPSYAAQMRISGVELIFADPEPALKHLRAGDTLFVPTVPRPRAMLARAVAKGVIVRTVAGV